MVTQCISELIRKQSFNESFLYINKRQCFNKVELNNFFNLQSLCWQVLILIDSFVSHCTTVITIAYLHYFRGRFRVGVGAEMRETSSFTNGCIVIIIFIIIMIYSYS